MAGPNRTALNQSPPLQGHNVVTGDEALINAVTTFGSNEIIESLAGLGAEAGTSQAREHAMLANQITPTLTPFDRYGNRIDEVSFHPSWHWLMERAVNYVLHAAPWETDSPTAHLQRAAAFFAW